MNSLAIITGIDIVGVSKCSERLEKFLAKKFPGKMHRLLRQEDLLH